MSQEALARELGTTQQTIQRIEKDITKNSFYKDLAIDFLSGNFESKAEWAIRAEERISKLRDRGLIDPDSSARLLKSDAATASHVQTRRDSVGLIPVYSTKLEDDEHLSIDSIPLKNITRPEPLLDTSDGYGLYIADNSMYPAVKSGEIVFVHPRLPPMIGEEHVFRGGPFEDAGEICVVRRLIGMTAFNFEVEKFNPEEKSELGRGLFMQCHRIVGKFTRL